MYLSIRNILIFLIYILFLLSLILCIESSSFNNIGNKPFKVLTSTQSVYDLTLDKPVIFDRKKINKIWIYKNGFITLDESLEDEIYPLMMYRGKFKFMPIQDLLDTNILAAFILSNKAKVGIVKAREILSSELSCSGNYSLKFFDEIIREFYPIKEEQVFRSVIEIEWNNVQPINYDPSNNKQNSHKLFIISSDVRSYFVLYHYNITQTIFSLSENNIIHYQSGIRSYNNMKYLIPQYDPTKMENEKKSSNVGFNNLWFGVMGDSSYVLNMGWSPRYKEITPRIRDLSNKFGYIISPQSELYKKCIKISTNKEKKEIPNIALIEIPMTKMEVITTATEKSTTSTIITKEPEPATTTTQEPKTTTTTTTTTQKPTTTTTKEPTTLTTSKPTTTTTQEPTTTTTQEPTTTTTQEPTTTTTQEPTTTTTQEHTTTITKEPTTTTTQEFTSTTTQEPTTTTTQESTTTTIQEPKTTTTQEPTTTTTQESTTTTQEPTTTTTQEPTTTTQESTTTTTQEPTTTTTTTTQKTSTTTQEPTTTTTQGTTITTQEPTTTIEMKKIPETKIDYDQKNKQIEKRSTIKRLSGKNRPKETCEQIGCKESNTECVKQCCVCKRGFVYLEKTCQPENDFNLNILNPQELTLVSEQISFLLNIRAISTSSMKLPRYYVTFHTTSINNFPNPLRQFLLMLYPIFHVPLAFYASSWQQEHIPNLSSFVMNEVMFSFTVNIEGYGNIVVNLKLVRDGSNNDQWSVTVGNIPQWRLDELKIKDKDEFDEIGSANRKFDLHYYLLNSNFVEFPQQYTKYREQSSNRIINVTWRGTMNIGDPPSCLITNILSHPLYIQYYVKLSDRQYCNTECDQTSCRLMCLGISYVFDREPNFCDGNYCDNDKVCINSPTSYQCECREKCIRTIQPKRQITTMTSSTKRDNLCSKCSTVGSNCQIMQNHACCSCLLGYHGSGVNCIVDKKEYGEIIWSGSLIFEDWNLETNYKLMLRQWPSNNGAIREIVISIEYLPSTTSEDQSKISNILQLGLIFDLPMSFLSFNSNNKNNNLKNIIQLSSGYININSTIQLLNSNMKVQFHLIMKENNNGNNLIEGRIKGLTSLINSMNFPNTLNEFMARQGYEVEYMFDDDGILKYGKQNTPYGTWYGNGKLGGCQSNIERGISYKVELSRNTFGCLHDCKDNKCRFHCRSMPVLNGPFKVITCPERCSPNAVCIQGSCICKSGYSGNGIRCDVIKKELECQSDYDCLSLGTSVTCQNSRCYCRSNSQLVDGKCVPQVKLECQSDSECDGISQQCSFQTNKCICKPNYLPVRVPDSSDRRCQFDCGICDSFSTTCDTTQCICRPGFVRNPAQLITPLTRCYLPCQANTDCPTYEICNVVRRICQCPGKKLPTGQCAPNINNCNNCHRFASCKDSNKCVCNSGFIGNGFVCMPDTTVITTKDPRRSNCVRCFNQAHCQASDDGGICICPTGYRGNGYECLQDMCAAGCPARSTCRPDSSSTKFECVCDDNGRVVSAQQQCDYMISTATAITTKKFQRLQINIYPDKEQIDLDEGKSFKMTCSVSSSIPIQWFRSSGKPIRARNVITDYNGSQNSLIFDELQGGDSDEYICFSNTGLRKFIKLNVIKSSPCSKCHQYATCQSNGLCVCINGYRGNGYECLQDMCAAGCPARSTCRPDSSSTKFECVCDDNGRVVSAQQQCYIKLNFTSIYTTATTTATTTINSIMSRLFIIPDGTQVTLEEQGTAKFICSWYTTSSTSDMSLQWFRSSGRQVRGRYIITDARNGLTIDNLQAEDADEYICVASNGQRKSIRLVILPRVNKCDTKCHKNAVCIDRRCRCGHGYYGDGYNCFPIKPCLQPCSNQNEQCDQTIGKCRCVTSYVRNMDYCQLDCRIGTQVCHSNARCDMGTGLCQCRSDYVGNGQQCWMRGINCKNNTLNCALNAQCTYVSKMRDYACVCNPGFIGNGSERCYTKLQCDNENCGPNSLCKTSMVKDHFGTLIPNGKCSCIPGFIRSPMGGHCKDKRKSNQSLWLAMGEALIKHDLMKNKSNIQYISNNGQIISEVVDCGAQRMILSDNDGRKISWTSLSEMNEFPSYLSASIGKAISVAVDNETGLVVYSDLYKRQLVIADLDKNITRVLVKTDNMTFEPSSLVIDSLERRVYWVMNDLQRPRIDSISLDGQSRETLIDLERPAVALLITEATEESRRQLCWLDIPSKLTTPSSSSSNSLGRLLCKNLGVSSVATVITTVENGQLSGAFSHVANTFYWGYKNGKYLESFYNGKVKKVPLTQTCCGAGIRSLISISSSCQKFTRKPCQDTQCTGICIRMKHNKESCLP